MQCTLHDTCPLYAVGDSPSLLVPPYWSLPTGPSLLVPPYESILTGPSLRVPPYWSLPILVHPYCRLHVQYINLPPLLYITYIYVWCISLTIIICDNNSSSAGTQHHSC